MPLLSRLLRRLGSDIAETELVRSILGTSKAEREGLIEALRERIRPGVTPGQLTLPGFREDISDAAKLELWRRIIRAVNESEDDLLRGREILQRRRGVGDFDVSPDRHIKDPSRQNVEFGRFRRTSETPFFDPASSPRGVSPDEVLSRAEERLRESVSGAGPGGAQAFQILDREIARLRGIDPAAPPKGPLTSSAIPPFQRPFVSHRAEQAIQRRDLIPPGQITEEAVRPTGEALARRDFEANLRRTTSELHRTFATGEPLSSSATPLASRLASLEDLQRTITVGGKQVPLNAYLKTLSKEISEKILKPLDTLTPDDIRARALALAEEYRLINPSAKKDVSKFTERVRFNNGKGSPTPLLRDIQEGLGRGSSAEAQAWTHALLERATQLSPSAELRRHLGELLDANLRFTGEGRFLPSDARPELRLSFQAEVDRFFENIPPGEKGARESLQRIMKARTRSTPLGTALRDKDVRIELPGQSGAAFERRVGETYKSSFSPGQVVRTVESQHFPDRDLPGSLLKSRKRKGTKLLSRGRKGRRIDSSTLAAPRISTVEIRKRLLVVLESGELAFEAASGGKTLRRPALLVAPFEDGIIRIDELTVVSPKLVDRVAKAEGDASREAASAGLASISARHAANTDLTNAARLARARTMEASGQAVTYLVRDARGQLTHLWDFTSTERYLATHPLSDVEVITGSSPIDVIGRAEVRVRDQIADGLIRRVLGAAEGQAEEAVIRRMVQGLEARAFPGSTVRLETQQGTREAIEAPSRQVDELISRFSQAAREGGDDAFDIIRRNPVFRRLVEMQSSLRRSRAGTSEESEAIVTHLLSQTSSPDVGSIGLRLKPESTVDDLLGSVTEAIRKRVKSMNLIPRTIRVQHIGEASVLGDALERAERGSPIQERLLRLRDNLLSERSRTSRAERISLTPASQRKLDRIDTRMREIERTLRLSETERTFRGLTGGSVQGRYARQLRPSKATGKLDDLSAEFRKLQEQRETLLRGRGARSRVEPPPTHTGYILITGERLSTRLEGGASVAERRPTWLLIDSSSLALWRDADAAQSAFRRLDARVLEMGLQQKKGPCKP